MVKKDQKMRKRAIKNRDKWDNKIDKINTKELKKIVSKNSWPDIDLVGKNSSNGAWLLIQHADHDVKFQKKCLKLMKEKMRDKKVALQNIAYLTDRIKVNQKMPQLYGTQFYVNKDKKFVPRPIRDKNNLDKRRRKFNLESFVKYKRNLIKL